jgi:GNAT superfamily N-acetyltransferase
MTAYAYGTSLDDVDWAALRLALAADDFDNGRTPQEYEASARASHANVFVRLGTELVGNGRILSDGVCNAYIVDVWTATPHRRRGIGGEIVRRLLATVPGQHVALLTSDQEAFYATLGFAVEREALSLVNGSWLGR